GSSRGAFSASLSVCGGRSREAGSALAEPDGRWRRSGNRGLTEGQGAERRGGAGGGGRGGGVSGGRARDALASHMLVARLGDKRGRQRLPFAGSFGAPPARPSRRVAGKPGRADE